MQTLGEGKVRAKNLNEASSGADLPQSLTAGGGSGNAQMGGAVLLQGLIGVRQHGNIAVHEGRKLRNGHQLGELTLHLIDHLLVVYGAANKDNGSGHLLTEGGNHLCGIGPAKRILDHLHTGKAAALQQGLGIKIVLNEDRHPSLLHHFSVIGKKCGIHYALLPCFSSSSMIKSTLRMM